MNRRNRVLRTISFTFAWIVHVAAVASAGAADLIDFDTEVMPVLTRQGCNAGACHGAAIGRGGFKLSLLGSNAAADHETIVHQLEGRRVNLAAPENSLLLRKPSEQLGHEGGLVLEEDTPAFDLLRRWIDQGAKRSGHRTLSKLTVTPQQQTLQAPGESVSVRVSASYNIGPPIDVTQWTVFQAADPDAVSISESGRTFTVHRRGVHVVIARFLDRVMPIRLTVPMHDEASGRTIAESATSVTGNEVDRYVNAQLVKLRLPSSPPADDWTFIRRVTLDLAGRLPTAAEARSFAADRSDNKRARLIDRLLQSDSFADYWALKWANVLGIDSKQLQPEGAAAYHHWIARQLAKEASADEMARAMLTSTGDSFELGAVNFLRSASSPGDLAEQASRIFLGVRLQCANCHDHPLDHWKQDDYHGLAAIFARLSRGRIVATSARGEVTHPVTGQPAVPRIPGDRYLSQSDDGREELADWLTSPENPYFARAIVNRLWKNLMGRGLVDPVDDLRATNPATHPELLQWLADDFVAHGFRLKHTVGVICNSAAYGRDSATVPGNEMDSSFYSHALVKPLEAEVIADAIADITGVPLNVGPKELPKAITLTDNRLVVPSLDVLGRCDRENACSESDASVSLARSLHLINGELINRRVAATQGRLHRLLSETPVDSEVLDEVFLWTLTQPSVSQTGFWQAQLESIAGASRQQRTQFFEDLLWSLMTSKSFASNR